MFFVLLVVVVLAAFVTVPLRRDGEAAVGEDPLRAELEARRDAKYRQIRDAEMDREQGKLTAEDWKRADAELRAEAIEILRDLDKIVR